MVRGDTKTQTPSLSAIGSTAGTTTFRLAGDDLTPSTINTTIPRSQIGPSHASMSSNFTARRAPNVSAYLANLNTVPSAQELAAQNNFDLGDDGLDFLTNTEFFDFDTFNPDLAQQKPQAVNGVSGPYHAFT